MSLKLYKKQNKGYKALNLNGVLFLINDHNDELGQHYDDSIYTLPQDLKKILMMRNGFLKELNIQYLFVIVPDKSVVMSTYLMEYLNNKQCERHFVSTLNDQSFFIDPLSEILQLLYDHNYPGSFPKDTHLNMLAFYGVYLSIIKKLGLKPIKYEVTHVSSFNMDLRSMDLTYPENNGNRPINNGQVWNIPLIITEHPQGLTNYYMDKNNGEIYHLNYEESLGDKYRHQTIHVYENSHSSNQDEVFIYHDCHLAMPDNDYLSRKEWFASHFKKTYFIWTTYDGQLFKKFPITKVIDCNTERLLNDYRCVESLFDQSYYLTKYQDIIDEPLKHFKEIGIFEGRFPNQAFETECQLGLRYDFKDDHFDNNYYLNKYPDIKTSIDKNEFLSGQQHYVNHGIKEGRWCNQMQEIRATFDINLFNPHFYQKKYPIFERFYYQFPIISHLQFYQLYGRRMGHLAYPNDPYKDFNQKYRYLDNYNFTEKLYLNFDPNYYLTTYGKQIIYPLYHYLNFGNQHLYAPNQWFDEKLYLNYHFKVRQQIKDGSIKYGFEHYLMTPINERLQCKFRA